MAEIKTTATPENAQGAAMSKRGQMFWNSYANLKAQISPGAAFDSNQELLTYIQADPRYVDYHQMFVNSQNLTADERAGKQQEALDIHRASDARLNEIDERGAYDTDAQGAANDFYSLIEQKHPSVEVAEDPPTPEAISAHVPSTAPSLPLNGQPLAEHFLAANDTAEYVLINEAAIDPVVVTATVAETDEDFDEAFAAKQFGPLAETPAEEITPHVAPIAAAVVPPPLLWTQERPIEEPVAEEPEVEGASILQFQAQKTPENDFQEYNVGRGDNLWNIAKSHYGFGRGDDAAIMEAVTKISLLNGLEEGTDANNLKIGQPLKLPDSPSLTNWNAQGTRLDWDALDAQTAARKSSANLGGHFNAAVQDQTSAPIPAPRPSLGNENVLTFQ